MQCIKFSTTAVPERDKMLFLFIFIMRFKDIYRIHFTKLSLKYNY